MASGYYHLTKELYDEKIFTDGVNTLLCFIPKDQRIFRYDESSEAYVTKKAILVDCLIIRNPPAFVSITELENRGIYVSKLDTELSPDIDFGADKDKIAFVKYSGS